MGKSGKNTAKYHITVEVIQTPSESCDELLGQFDFLPTKNFTLDTQVTVTDTTTGEIIGQETFDGHPLPPCPDSGEVLTSLEGTTTATGIIESWIITKLSDQSTLPALNKERPKRSGIFTDQNSKFEALPLDWFVEAEDYPKYKLDLKKYNFQVKCSYLKISTQEESWVGVYRVYNLLLVELLDLDTNEIVLKDIILGPEPDECPEEISFNQNREKIIGGAPTQDEVTQKLQLWLEPFVIDEGH